MLYWLSVYALVALIVAAPFLLLYVVGWLLWWSFVVVRHSVRSIGSASSVLADLSRFAVEALKARGAHVKSGRRKYENTRHHDDKCIVHS